MINDLIAGGVATTVILAVLGGLAWAMRRSGTSDQANKQLESNADAVAEAAQARDAIDRDPAERQRVRDRFTR